MIRECFSPPPLYHQNCHKKYQQVHIGRDHLRPSVYLRAVGHRPPRFGMHGWMGYAASFFVSPMAWLAASIFEPVFRPPSLASILDPFLASILACRFLPQILKTDVFASIFGRNYCLNFWKQRMPQLSGFWTQFLTQFLETTLASNFWKQRVP